MRVLCLSFVAIVAAHSAIAETTPPEAPAPRSIECIAAFEIMDRAAPNWTQQDSVLTAWQGWEGQALRLVDRANVDFGTQINREMTSLAASTVEQPELLSERALRCVAEAPPV